MNILLTGGLGYIGSHVAITLMQDGHKVTIVDNLSNCKIEVLHRLESILGEAPHFIRGDIRDQSLLENAMRNFGIEAVMHFAGFKSVGESTLKPLMYYENNVSGTVSLLKAMQSCNLRKLVFSSSATVYGAPQYLPIDEAHQTKPESPYGQTKLQIEQILRDLAVSDLTWNIIALRYFNPVGAHESGFIGEEPLGIPNNLMPYVSKVASGTFDRLRVFGDDFETPDGTGIRDYIHVMDLADGHLAALHYLIGGGVNFSIINLGTGTGYSVLELIDAYEKVSGQKISYEKGPRRSGDIACCYANVDEAKIKLDWKARRNLYQMCEDSWRWQQKYSGG